MRHLSFERLCRDLVGLVLASAAATACGGNVEGANRSGNGDGQNPGSPGTTTSPEEEWTSACTTDDRGPSTLDGFTPEPNVDFLAERWESEPFDGSPTNSDKTFDTSKIKVETRMSRGTACVTATDPAACTKKLDTIRAVRVKSDCEYGQTGTCFARYFVYTRGDEVALIRADDVEKTRSAMLQFFGKVDSSQEAFFLAEQGGRYGRCSGPSTEWARFRRVAGAIEIVVVESGCQKNEKRLTLRVSPDGTEEVIETKDLGSRGACAGRRPDGFRLRAVAGRSDHDDACDAAVGDHLALLAELEDAAVHAFGIMIDELVELEAPADLVARARAARADEIRHTKKMAALARHRGGSPKRAEVAPRKYRSIEAMALENAVEGCVRETYAALVTLFQGERAVDPEVRAALASIAIDEVAHAKLSLDVGVFLESRLDDAARARIAEARQKALEDLAREVALPPNDDVRELVGLPTANEARALIEMTRALAA